MINNNKGSALLFVMLALIGAGFMAKLVIDSTHHSSVTEIQFSSSESARLAVQSGFASALSKIQTSIPSERDNLIKRLNDLLEINDLNSNSADDLAYLSGNSETDYWEDFSSGRYRVRIVALDIVNMTISLFSEGVGRGNARASALGTYALEGLTLSYKEQNIPFHALQLDNGNFEFNCKFTVNGDTYVKNRMKMNNGPALFNGRFRIGTSGTGGEHAFGVHTTITNSAYFEVPFKMDGGSVNFKGDVAFEKNITLNLSSQLKFTEGKKLYFNGGVNSGDDAILNLGQAKVHLGRPASEYRSSTTKVGANFLTESSNTLEFNQTLENLGPSLGFIDPEPINFNRNVIPSYRHKLISGPVWTDAARLGGAAMNTLYNKAQEEGTLWNDFIIIEVGPNTTTSGEFSPFRNDGVPFTGKAIILVTNRSARLNRFYESSLSANTAILIDDYPTLNPTFTNIHRFRGFIYVKKSSQQLVISGHNLHIHGSVYMGPDAKSKFDGSETTIHWDKNVIDELAMLGLFVPDGKEDDKSLVLRAERQRIGATLLSRSF